MAKNENQKKQVFNFKDLNVCPRKNAKSFMFTFKSHEVE